MPSSACDWSSDVCSSDRSEEHTSELQSRSDLVCRLLLEKKKRLNSSHDQISYAVFCLKKKDAHEDVERHRAEIPDGIHTRGKYEHRGVAAINRHSRDAI